LNKPESGSHVFITNYFSGAESARKLTEQLEAFLKACQAEGDVSIEDVPKRLEKLREQT